jgi:hypothetical protein
MWWRQKQVFGMFGGGGSPPLRVAILTPAPPVALYVDVEQTFTGTCTAGVSGALYWDAGHTSSAGTLVVDGGAWTCAVTPGAGQVGFTTLYARVTDGEGYAYDSITITVEASEEESTKVWVLGDSQDSNTHASSFTSLLSLLALQASVDVVVGVGDSVDSGTQAKYNLFGSQISALADPSWTSPPYFFSCLGNHDVGTGYETYRDAVLSGQASIRGSVQYFTVVTGTGASAIRWIILDSENYSAAQTSWLAGVLESATETWVIPVWHKPTYPADTKGFSSGIGATLDWIQLFEDSGKVKVVLVGHDHLWERTYPMKLGVRSDSDGIVYLMASRSCAVQYWTPVLDFTGDVVGTSRTDHIDAEDFLADADSESADSVAHGALYIEATADTLTATYYEKNGASLTQIDTVEIPAPSGGSLEVAITTPAPDAALYSGVALACSGTCTAGVTGKLYWDSGYTSEAGTLAVVGTNWTCTITPKYAQVSVTHLYARVTDGEDYGYDDVTITVTQRTPLNLFANILRWWATDNAGNTVTNGRMQTVVDANGSGETYTQATEANRFYVETSDATYGGRQSINANGVNCGHALRLNKTSGSTISQPYTQIYVGCLEAPDATSGKGVLGSGGNSYSGTYKYTGNVNLYVRSSTEVDSGLDLTNNKAFAIRVYWNGTSTVVEIRYSDGTGSVSSAVSPGTNGFEATDYIGNGGSGTVGWGGSIVDRICVNGNLGAGEWDAFCAQWLGGRLGWTQPA